jgi:uncharacterized protein (TIGR03086 family)
VSARTHTVDAVSPLDVRELDRRAVALSTQVVDRVRPQDLARPTPCAEWTLRDLLRHMAAQHRGFAAAARGHGADPGVWAPPDRSDTAPVEAHQSAAADVVAAFEEVDLDAAQLTLPDFGGRTFRAAQAMSFHAIDYLVHAWDVGASIGVPVRPDDDLLPAALDITLAVPVGDARTRPGAAFAPVLAGVEADPDPWRRILGMLGRDPDWVPR